jgi:hypothetical protein
VRWAAVNGGTVSRAGIRPNTYWSSVLCAAPSGKVSVVRLKSSGGFGSLNSYAYTPLRRVSSSARRAGQLNAESVITWA